MAGFDRFGVLIVLVITRPDDDGRMGVETVDVVDCFSGDRVPERRDMGWVVPTAEGKVLPDEDTEFVAGVVECFFFVDSTSPDTSLLVE